LDSFGPGLLVPTGVSPLFATLRLLLGPFLALFLILVGVVLVRAVLSPFLASFLILLSVLAPLLVAHARSIDTRSWDSAVRRFGNEFDFQFQEARRKVDSELEFLIAGYGDEVVLVIGVLDYYRVL